MMAQFRTLVILAVFLLAPFSSAVENPVENDVDERDLAASYWHSIQPMDTTMSSLKSLDYSIHLESGSFDPLVDEWPKSRLDNLGSSI